MEGKKLLYVSDPKIAPLGDTEMDPIVARMMDNHAHSIDEALKILLKQNGLEVPADRQELELQGYIVVMEKNPLNSFEETIKLCKLVDYLVVESKFAPAQ